MSFKIIDLRLQLHLQGANELMYLAQTSWWSIISIFQVGNEDELFPLCRPQPPLWLSGRGGGE